MKRILLLLLSITALFSACKNKTAFIIDGKFENAQNVKKVLLYKGDLLVDSAILNDKSEFRLQIPSPDPDFFYLVADSKNYLLLAKDGDELKFNADYTSPVGAYSIEGSEDAESLEEFNAINNKYGKVFVELKTQYDQLVTANPEQKDAISQKLTPQFDANMKAFAKESLSFAAKNNDNLAGFYAMSMLDPVDYEDQLIKYSESLKGKFATNKPVQEFIVKMDKIKPIAKGQPALDFQSEAPNGHLVKLSDFKGKYVLLDFWASWCGPCRQENPNIVKQYQAFKNKNFTILGVSLDNDKAAWLKAIKDDHLDWNHVSDLKQWNSAIARQYQVEGIPASFLIDPSGIIVAKNLRGADLEEFLKKTLK